MQGGRLDRTITLQRSTSTRSTSGEMVDSWSTVAIVPAQKIEARGDERFSGEQMVGSVNRSFRIRWSNDVKGITAQWRLVFEGVTHEISAVREIGRRIGIEIDCFARGEEATVAGG
jgi:SPP1 family predicted phage head-tail adaptor